MVIMFYVQTNPFGPTSFNAILSARMDELPCAIFAKGPACTKTGLPYKKKMQDDEHRSFNTYTSVQNLTG